MANGLLTNTELIESLLVDLNEFLKQQINGQFIQASCIVAKMSQKLINLRATIDNDLKNREKTIETLKKELRHCGVDIQDMTPQEFIKEIKGEPNNG